MNFNEQLQQKAADAEDILKISSGRGRVSEKSDRGHELQCSGRGKKTQTGFNEGELSSVWRAGRSDRAFYGSS